jgi:hypothetical protein
MNLSKVFFSNQINHEDVNLFSNLQFSAMLLLLLAAAVRHTGGYSWAYNTRPSATGFSAVPSEVEVLEFSSEDFFRTDL